MSESALLRAVRNRIRLHADFADNQVNVEYDENAPATAGDLYIMVIPGGVEGGPLQDSGRTQDIEYRVNVAVAIRAPRKPRDRKRELLTGIEPGGSALVDSFETHINAINAQLDFDYATITAANALMIAEGTATDTCDTFIEPLRFSSLGPVREAPAETFAGFGGERIAALIRTIQYRGARRLVKRA